MVLFLFLGLQSTGTGVDKDQCLMRTVRRLTRHSLQPCIRQPLYNPPLFKP